MAVENYQVEPLFAEPVCRADIGHAISDEQIAYIKNLKTVETRDNLVSEDLYILEHPELQSIKDALQEALDIYAREVMGISQSLYITQSWSVINHPNSDTHGHSHSNSVVSGSLYYCELPTPVASMIFNRSRNYQQLKFIPERNKQNIFNSPLNIITPKPNEVILFSSGLNHLAETNAAPDPIYTIEFNTFIKGKLGNYRDVSELKL